MGTQKNQFRELAGRYKAGLCTPGEIEQVKEWYDFFEKNGYVLPHDDEIERASNEAALAAIKQVSGQNRNEKIRRLINPVLKIAAVLLVVCLAGLFLYKINQRAAKPVIFNEISATAGEKKQITLPDGSVIFLNSASSIRYPNKFIGDNREIQLKGEAFFEIAHDKRHPFIIHTEQLKIQVLGTSFDVNAYHKDQEVVVAVATGKVGVTGRDKNNPKTVLLIPGELLSYNKLTTRFDKRPVKTADISDWRQNILTFNFETLEKISGKLERVYGVTFVFNDRSILKKRFRLKVKNESLSNIMKLLSISGGGFRYKITGKQVIIG
jgi:transmembrane sensor